jgi:hypothetical protein
MALSERQRLWSALVVAAVLHGTLAWFALRAPGAPVSVRYSDPGTDDLLWLDEPSSGARAESAGPLLPPSTSDAASGSTSGASSGRSVAALSRPSQTHAAAPTTGETSAELEAAPSRPGGAEGGEASGSGPQLSLDELGVGKNPFLAGLADAPSERPRRSSLGFRRSMAESIVKREQRLGLGPEGPILKRLEQETRQSETPPNSRARFRASIDRKGNLVAFELLDATSDYRPWQRLAARLLEALRGQQLRVPKTGRGLSLVLSLESRAQLPSGADPGLAVDLFGIPVKKGGGKRSHKISLLSVDPGGKEMEIKLPGGQTMHLPEPPKIVLFGLGFDPVDIGAPSQRVVHSHVEHVTSDDIPDAEPPAADTTGMGAPAPTR